MFKMNWFFSRLWTWNLKNHFLISKKKTEKYKNFDDDKSNANNKSSANAKLNANAKSSANANNLFDDINENENQTDFAKSP